MLYGFALPVFTSRVIIYRYDAGPTLCCMVLLFVYVLLLGLLVVYGFRQEAVGLMFVRCL